MKEQKEAEDKARRELNAEANMHEESEYNDDAMGASAVAATPVSPRKSGARASAPADEHGKGDNKWQVAKDGVVTKASVMAKLKGSRHYARRVTAHTWVKDKNADKGPNVKAALKAGLFGKSDETPGSDLFLSVDQDKLEAILAALPEKGSRSLVADAMDHEMATLEEVLFAFEECMALRRCGFLIQAFSVNCWWWCARRTACASPRVCVVVGSCRRYIVILE